MHKIELTQEEVDALVMILERIGGSGTFSRRKHADEIYRKINLLESEGPVKECCSGGIYFVDFDDEIVLI